MYRLRWTEPFQRWLGTVWDGASDVDRLRIANAINALSHKLSLNPLSNSESRGGKSRIAVEQPLTVYFTIDFATDVVSVFRGSFK